jgi:hypothetical protein
MVPYQTRTLSKVFIDATTFSKQFRALGLLIVVGKCLSANRWYTTNDRRVQSTGECSLEN